MGAEADPVYIRRPYTGSCHCGTFKYIAYLALPTPSEGIDIHEFRKNSGVRVYKCNCNACHKMGFFHFRLRFAPDDFVLLTPADPDAEDSGLKPYLTPAKAKQWWFCKGCGVRCFTHKAETERADVEVPTKSLRELGINVDAPETSQLTTVKAWKFKKEGYLERPAGNAYFSLNALTLNPEQEGLDLREFHERQWIAYDDTLHEKEEWRTGRPQVGGIY